MAPQPPMEHDYIGLSEVPPSCMGTSHNLDDLNGTDLRLGPPGSGSPERKDMPLLTLGLSKICYGSGAKRVFSDAIDESGKWVFPGGKGCDGEMGKGGALFSPMGENVKEEGPKSKGNGGRNETGITPAAKAQVVGWPPIRSYRKNSMAANPSKNNDDTEDKNGSGSLYVKVSMDGAPYLRKVDLRTLSNYKELSMALEKMFSCFTIGHCGSYGLPSKDGLSENRLTDLLHGSEHVLTYEDKDGDWMLVGDVPWDMFTETCRRLRIMKGSEAIGLAPRAAEKGKTRK